MNDKNYRLYYYRQGTSKMGEVVGIVSDKGARAISDSSYPAILVGSRDFDAETAEAKKWGIDADVALLNYREGSLRSIYDRARETMKTTKKHSYEYTLNRNIAVYLEKVFPELPSRLAATPLPRHKPVAAENCRCEIVTKKTRFKVRLVGHPNQHGYYTHNAAHLAIQEVYPNATITYQPNPALLAQSKDECGLAQDAFDAFINGEKVAELCILKDNDPKKPIEASPEEKLRQTEIKKARTTAINTLNRNIKRAENFIKLAEKTADTIRKEPSCTTACIEIDKISKEIVTVLTSALEESLADLIRLSSLK